jgi:MFS family permease
VLASVISAAIANGVNPGILPAMSKLLDSFWRAVMYCLHPRVIALSVLPVVIMGVFSLGLGYLYWESALALVRESLERFELVNAMGHWLDGLGLGSLRLVLAPALLLFLAIPVIVIITLLFVAMFMTPAMVAMVAERRFPRLERKKGGSMLASVLWSLGSTLLAIIALLVSIPLWLIPPLILILPPLIWGWLTYRVMSYDALAEHASSEERRQIFKENRLTLLGIGVLSGYLGTVPSLIWASGAMFVAMAPILVPVAIWLYTLVFAFSSLWFAHYTLAALEQLRKENSVFPPDLIVQDAIEPIANEPVPETLPNPVPDIASPGGQPDSKL